MLTTQGISAEAFVEKAMNWVVDLEEQVVSLRYDRVMETFKYRAWVCVVYVGREGHDKAYPRACADTLHHALDTWQNLRIAIFSQQ